MKGKAFTKRLLPLLKKHYPEAKCRLNYQNSFQLLVATILSAQCTDERVNEVTKVLFKKYPQVKDLAKAKVQEIEKIIFSTGFYKNKAKNIKLTSEMIVKKHKSQVPKKMEDLVELPGVGRKTANVVLGNAFNIKSGIVVDTHVSRLSFRFGLTRSKDPVKIEENLIKVIPKKDWVRFSHFLILHGRGPCKSQKAHCYKCFLEVLCPQKLSK